MAMSVNIAAFEVGCNDNQFGKRVRTDGQIERKTSKPNQHEILVPSWRLSTEMARNQHEKIANVDINVLLGLYLG